MPKNKDLKRLTRSRMQKTGESYTTARTRLLEKRDQTQRDGRPASADLAALAGMSDDAVRKATGLDWQDWVRELDAVDAASMEHPAIALHIREDRGLSGWWSQMVTVGYERIKGLREIGQRRSGSYEINKSKTVAVPIGMLYEAFSVARKRRRWLLGVELEIRKRTPEKSIRATWADGTAVDVYFTAKSETKSQVTVQHRKLASKPDADRLRTYWGERLEALAAMLSDS